MWLVELLKSIFKFGTSANEVAIKALPSEKIQEEKFEIRKPTLTEAEVKKIADKRNRLADEMFGDLVGHPELSVADKVRFEATELNKDEQDLLIKILTDRLNTNEHYLRKKNKTSKFRL